VGSILFLISGYLAFIETCHLHFASINFNGTWVLDLKASDSPEPMMKRMGVSVLERKLAASTKLEAAYSQSGDLLGLDRKTHRQRQRE
jgi:hypothetical protein